MTSPFDRQLYISIEIPTMYCMDTMQSRPRRPLVVYLMNLWHWPLTPDRKHVPSTISSLLQFEIRVGYTTVWSGIHTRVYTTRDYGTTYLFHDRRATANTGLQLVTLQWSGLWDVILLQTLCWEIGDKSRSWNKSANSINWYLYLPW